EQLAALAEGVGMPLSTLWALDPMGRTVLRHALGALFGGDPFCAHLVDDANGAASGHWAESASSSDVASRRPFRTLRSARACAAATAAGFRSSASRRSHSSRAMELATSKSCATRSRTPSASGPSTATTVSKEYPFVFLVVSIRR